MQIQVSVFVLGIIFLFLRQTKTTLFLPELLTQTGKQNMGFYSSGVVSV